MFGISFNLIGAPGRAEILHSTDPDDSFLGFSLGI
jgi:hypothetical protein